MSGVELFSSSVEEHDVKVILEQYQTDLFLCGNPLTFNLMSTMNKDVIGECVNKILGCPRTLKRNRFMKDQATTLYKELKPYESIKLIFLLKAVWRSQTLEPAIKWKILPLSEWLLLEGNEELFERCKDSMFKITSTNWMVFSPALRIAYELNELIRPKHN